MAWLHHEGPPSEEYERDIFTYVSYSLSWPSSGPSEAEVPMSSLSQSSAKQHPNRDEQRIEAHNAAAPTSSRCKNPLPATGSRRDACGRWSVGSEGHDIGRCQGPCKDIRSGRGCTWGKKCKRCHFPHPEVSSSSIRSKKSKVRLLAEQLLDEGADAYEYFGLRGHSDHRSDLHAQPSDVRADVIAHSLRLGTTLSL
eukprot:TRINITY_DN743_c0_g1_i3.p1 TRINITY_DN743_c0_g1~~TRINITY_DN743_c0_g1_i3.p1  ORF type:complete len:197 (+),score=4.40 TRINITY_DN743_c0_g1_i3:70-660(+)